MMRSAALSNESVDADVRAAHASHVLTQPISLPGVHWYPRMYALHPMLMESSKKGAARCGEVGADGRVMLPRMMRLSREMVANDGAYLVRQDHDGIVCCPRMIRCTLCPAYPLVLQRKIRGYPEYAYMSICIICLLCAAGWVSATTNCRR